MPDDPFVSVVVPTYNRCASLRRLFDALANQTYPRDRFEVVVVDDGSSDGTAEMVRTLAVPYTLRLVQQSNSGPSVARNRGVAEAQGSIVVFVDDDVIPSPDLIAEHVRARQGDPNLVVIGPMLPPSGHWPRGIWVRWGEENLEKQYRALAAGEYECTPRQFYTANASVPRAAFLATNGFDTSFLRNEDVELGFRLRDHQGLGFKFNPKAAIEHYPEHSFKKWRDVAYQYGRYDVIMEREKNLPQFQAATGEFRHRNSLARRLIRVCVGRPLLYQSAVGALSLIVRAADNSRFEKVASFALSALFGLLYWQGVADELGGSDRAWARVAAVS
jgi:GT2 family glycosyltransferase